MRRIYFTITRMRYCFGSEFLKEGMMVRLVKEPENHSDNEAIRVELKGLGKIGYVAASPQTRIGESMSAGRLGIEFDKVAFGKVLYIMHNGTVCELINRKKRH